MPYVGENPLDLTQAMDWFEGKLSDEDRKVFFESIPEEEMGARLHHSAGRGLRNTLKLWDINSSMFKYFRSIGITHADDMSSIILTSLHRRINNKDIDLEGLVKHDQNYWKQNDVPSGIPEIGN